MVDDIHLMTWLDGELSPEERQAVEREMKMRPELAAQAALARVQYDACRNAFLHQKLPPVPESLVQKVDALVRAHTRTTMAGANDAFRKHGVAMRSSAPVRSRFRLAPAWLAVAFVGGAFCVGAVVRFAPVATSALDRAGAMFTVDLPGSTPWVQAVVHYQQLYARETVASARMDEKAVAQTVADIRRSDNLAVTIPDLREAGLTFGQVQRLRFHGKPLAQIVYLPEKGQPVALCVMAEAKPDQPPIGQRIDDMDVVTWRHAGLGYVLVGRPGDTDLAALGRRIVRTVLDQSSGIGMIGSLAAMSLQSS